MPHDSTTHDRHDPMLVVSLAAGDLAGTDRDRATDLIRECPECARLHDDLIAIARATAALPAAASPRDFRITPEQAERLRPTGWRRFVAAFGAPRFSRQLGVGMATLGLAGLLLSALPPLQIGLGGSAAAPAGAEAAPATDRLGAYVQGPAASASSVRAPAFQPSSAPSTSSYYDTLTSAGASAAPAASSGKGSGDGNGVAVAQGAQPTASRDASAPEAAVERLAGAEPSGDSGMSLFMIASAILLIAGIALLLARRVAGTNATR